MPGLKARQSSALTVASMSNEICFGRWFGDFLIVSRERLDQFVEWDRLIRRALKADSWGELLIDTDWETVERVLGSTLDSVWWSQDPSPEEDRGEGERPPILSLTAIFERVDTLEMLNDLSSDPWLPPAIGELAEYLETSPATGYDPVQWHEGDLQEVRAYCEARNFLLVDETELMDGLSISL